MSYVAEFRASIENQDAGRMLQLWEEYCTNDTVDGEELREILDLIRGSDLSRRFGEYVEVILPLWKEITNPDLSYEVLRLIFDLQTTNSEQLADLGTKVLEKRYGNQEYYQEKLRLVGLRNRESFEGALRNYDLLTHLDKGKFVFHTGGWGTGEILDYSLVREEIVLEFENVVGKKYFSFSNAYKHLITLTSDHFLARRFGNPDALEKAARNDPLEVIRLLLKDLGPKTAAEIKDEMCGLVIPEDEWTKWWQNARAKIKKDTKIETPHGIKDPFRVRGSEVSHGNRFLVQIEQAKTPIQQIQVIYNFTRDFPEILKDTVLKAVLHDLLHSLEKHPELSLAKRLQVCFLAETIFGPAEVKDRIDSIIDQIQDFGQLVEDVDIIAFKKRALVAIRKCREDWAERFLDLMCVINQVQLRDYIFKELAIPESEDLLTDRLEGLLNDPVSNPEVFLWYFQKILTDSGIPFANKEGQCRFFETMLILFQSLENDPDQREATKKLYQLISVKRFENVRKILEGSSDAFAKEILLLVAKLHSLSDHDKKIMRSLIEVAHPHLADKKSSELEEEPIWTTEQGYQKIKDKIRHIGTVETVENAREIEKARAHGDLRENSEYKFALEKRSQLQGQMKMFSEQVNRARVLTEHDIDASEISVGTVATIHDSSSGKDVTYTILGPWDADAEQNIISFQSQLAKAMRGHREGEQFDFQGIKYKVKKIKSFLEA
jgi:transcription elongation factor GreA